MLPTHDRKMHLKLAQFYELLDDQAYDENFAKHMLASFGASLNYKISTTSFLPQNVSLSTGITVLHLALHKENKVIFDHLLNLGTDFTAKEDNGSTVVHQSIESIIKENSIFSKPTKHHSFVDSVLEAHMKYENTANPCNNNGLSHFHAACMTSNTRAVEFFLNNGVSANESISSNSSMFPGYTPLHFAVDFLYVDLTKLLLKHGASRHLKNTEGLNPLHLLTRYTVDWHYRWNSGEVPPIDIYPAVQILKLLLYSDLDKSVDDLGFSLFHAACTSSQTIAKLPVGFIDPNICVSANSPIFPGYNAAHFAARCDVAVAKSLFRQGRYVDLEDANGVTPFELCLERYSVTDIRDIVSEHPIWKDILLSDGETKLVDLLHAMITPTSRIHLFLIKNGHLTIPVDSPLWPGYSALHLAVVFTERPKDVLNYNPSGDKATRKFKPNLELVTKCLGEKADVTVQDVHGMTPVHFAFRLGRRQVVKLLLDAHRRKEDFVDHDNLSHLHVACAAKNAKLARTLIANSHGSLDLRTNVAFPWYTNATQMDFNVTIGAESTPLHVAVAVENGELVKCLLKNRADLYAKNVDGRTPLHLLLLNTRSNICKRLAITILRSVDVVESVAKDGSTHLHVASAADNVRVIKALCENGSDIDAAIAEGSWMGYTPLHLAMERGNVNATKCLIELGANVLAKKPNGMAPFYEMLSSGEKISDRVFVVNLEKNIGLTRLHYDCAVGNWKAVLRTLERGKENVSARLKDDSPIWPGMTPLHIVATKLRSEDSSMQTCLGIVVCLLVDFGADVTARDAEGNTPVHLAFKAVWESEGRLKNFSARLQVQILLQAHRDLANNPMGCNGISHFHVACFFHDANVIEFLKQGVKVDEIVENDCYTPLHLALIYHSSRQLLVVDLLLRYGADVQVQDKRGDAPLHLAMKFSAMYRGDLFKILVKHGANVMATNALGKTPFELLLKSKDALATEVEMFLRDVRCRANSFNPYTGEGYLTMIFSIFCPNPRIAKNGFLDFIIDITDRDELGRTCLHNAASFRARKSFQQSYAYMLTILLQCRVDCRDNLGRTALHLAARFGNYDAVNSLLLAGADVNEEDKDGRAPLCYALMEPPSRFEQDSEKDRKITVEILSEHVRKMLYCGLYASPANMCLADSIGVSINVLDELDGMKDVKIGSGQICLFDLIFETKVVMAYPTMSVDNRNAFQDFFRDYKNLSKFKETKSLLVFQYKKALKMRRWFQDATESLRILMGFRLPELCSDIILRFSIYWDVRNLIVAAKSESGLVT